MRVAVCRGPFLSLHVVSQKRVRRLQNLLFSGKVPSDIRGHQRNQKIHSGESHNYSHKRYYLDAKLSVSNMNNLFQLIYPNAVVKYAFYNKIFKENFSYSFGAIAEFAVLTRSEKFYNSMREKKKLCQHNESVLGKCFDFMQNIGLPNIPVRDLYYLRRKGPDKTYSFLLHYIHHNVAQTITELHIYSDSCGGQNKNHTLLRLCLSLTYLGMFDRIIHRCVTVTSVWLKVF
ncbi:hypothetical protein PR048_013507 [Dryococelus australis]|uniref:Uncharacterized protein n=1 Tax=Dryococelus australis TaxID=614101 RepID=A0ABQ9HSE2_9NEOP|nr:hypothetical protein PR048_013507 [Dryococelus australis]